MWQWNVVILKSSPYGGLLEKHPEIFSKVRTWTRVSTFEIPMSQPSFLLFSIGMAPLEKYLRYNEQAFFFK